MAVILIHFFLLFCKFCHKFYLNLIKLKKKSIVVVNIEYIHCKHTCELLWIWFLNQLLQHLFFQSKWRNVCTKMFRFKFLQGWKTSYEPSVRPSPGRRNIRTPYKYYQIHCQIWNIKFMQIFESNIKTMLVGQCLRQNLSVPSLSRRLTGRNITVAA